MSNISFQLRKFVSKNNAYENELWLRGWFLPYS